jgi:hypothetical protein
MEKWYFSVGAGVITLLASFVFIPVYGLPIGAVLGLVVAALFQFFLLGLLPDLLWV